MHTHTELWRVFSEMGHVVASTAGAVAMFAVLVG